MRKWIACLLTLVLLVGVLPAALAAETASVEFEVGFGRADVTPVTPDGAAVGDIHLAGNSDTATRLAEGVASDDERLYMNAVALSDGTNTHVVMTTDFIRVPIKWNEYVEEAVLNSLTDDEKKAYQLSEGFVSMSATHTHSSVDIGDRNANTTAVDQGTKWHNSSVADVTKNGRDTTYYTNYWLPGAVAAVKAALADLQTATIQVGRASIPGMTWVRHWFYSDGTMNGVNFKSGGGTVIGHPRDADSEMQLIRFVREGKDVVLINWQAHPTGAMGSISKKLSSEYCGIMCRYLEEKDNDCYAAFFQGAAGNLQFYTSVPAERTKWSATGNYKTYGERLGAKAWDALRSSNVMHTVQPGAVKSLRNENTVVERGYATTRTIQQDVITIGNRIAFVTAGYEMFDSNGMYVKQQARKTGYEIVFIIENAQGHEYMPDWQTTHYTLLGGPEAYEAEETCFNEVPGTAEDLADALIHMLKNLTN